MESISYTTFQSFLSFGHVQNTWVWLPICAPHFLQNIFEYLWSIFCYNFWGAKKPLQQLPFKFPPHTGISHSMRIPTHLPLLLLYIRIFLYLPSSFNMTSIAQGGIQNDLVEMAYTFIPSHLRLDL